METYSRDHVKEFVDVAVKSVAAAARSAPQTTGQLDLVINILDQKEIAHIQDAIQLPGAPRAAAPLIYDGMLTIGAKVTHSDTHWDCGACGFKKCADLNRAPRQEGIPGPSCNWKVVDWCIAIDYAAAMATQLGLQTRVQDIQGGAALRLGYAGDVDVCTTVPLMAEKRNPFFQGRGDAATKEMFQARKQQVEAAFRRIFPFTMDLDMVDVLLAGFDPRLSTNLAGTLPPEAKKEE
jgi:uncharacterized ferredoxin-like protein